MSARLKRRNNKPSLGKLWQPAVILAVLAIVAYGVHTVRGNNENISHPAAPSTIPATVVPINPKNVTYEAFGTLGGSGKVVYANLDSQPIEVRLASLPWSHSETTMSPSATLSLVMQVDGDSAGCRILVDGLVRDEHLVSHPERRCRLHGDRSMNEKVPTPPKKPDDTEDTEDTQNTENEVKRPRAAKLARRFALPIVLFWVLAAIVTNVFVPSIEENTTANAKALTPRDAPSSQAALVQGGAFRESEYTSAVVILFETQGRKLGDQDHQYYNELVRRLRGDKQHVQSLLDLWGKPVTTSGQQSADGEAATLTVRPTGDTGDATSSRSIAAIRDIVAKTPKPKGLNTYVTGPAALNTDTLAAADDSMFTLTIVSVIVIIIMLLLAYRSVARALIPLVGVLLILATARGVVSFLVGLHVLGISSFAMNMLVALVLGVATDYGIFFIGRYNEARRAGHDKESAYYESVANTSHVILGSGLAISGSTLCLSLTKLNYFRTLGPPCFVGMVVAVVAALTLGPAMLALGGRIKWLQRISPTSPMWRRLGTAIARWPAAMIFIAALVVPLCVMNLATYKVSYNDRDFAPDTRRVRRRVRGLGPPLPEEPAGLRLPLRAVGSRHAQHHRPDHLGQDRQDSAPGSGHHHGGRHHPAQWPAPGARFTSLCHGLRGNEDRREP